MFKNNTHRGLGNKGFSLVELIIVVAIMAALIAILAPQYIKYVEKTRVATDDTFADELYGAVQVAVTDEDVYEALTANIVVTWAADGVTFAPEAAEGNGTTALVAELTATLGTDFADTEMASNTRANDDDDYEITIDVSGGAPEITDNRDEWTTPADEETP